jgi:hypothetical protein
LLFTATSFRQGQRELESSGTLGNEAAGSALLQKETHAARTGNKWNDGVLGPRLNGYHQTQPTLVSIHRYLVWDLNFHNYSPVETDRI